MKTETIMWLLPIVFMIHDFEEIIMMKPWVNKNAAFMTRRFPRLAARILPHFKGLSTSAFALAVLAMFLLVSTVTLISVQLGLYALWAGLLIGFFVHLLVHIGQFIVVRRYVPVVITSILAVPYCIWALFTVYARTGFSRSGAIVWAVVALIVITISVPLAHALAARFERWLKKRYSPQ